MSSLTKTFFSNARRTEILITLIREDLKSQKIFDHLRSLGLEDTFYQSDLTEIVLSETGLTALSEKDHYFYCCLVKEFAPRVTTNKKHLDELAWELLCRLLEEKRKRTAAFT